MNPDLKYNVYNLANPTGLPMTLNDVLNVRCRSAFMRTDLPYVGQQVKYRHEDYGPLVDAKILSVDMENRGDHNVWRYVLDANRIPVELHGVRVMELVDDPWPSVRLQTVKGFLVDTREARFPGSPGWLPLSEKD